MHGALWSPATSASAFGKVVLGCGQLVAHSVQESGKVGQERSLLRVAIVTAPHSTSVRSIVLGGCIVHALTDPPVFCVVSFFGARYTPCRTCS